MSSRRGRNVRHRTAVENVAQLLLLFVFHLDDGSTGISSSELFGTMALITLEPLRTAWIAIISCSINGSAVYFSQMQQRFLTAVAILVEEGQ